MSSERRTDNIDYSSYRRQRNRRNRRIIMIRSMMLIAVLLAVLLLIIFVIVRINKSRITDYYDTEAGYARVLTMDRELDELVPFAKDIAVVKPDYDNLPDVYTAEAGLLTECSGVDVAYQKNALNKMHPASTTKIMTAICALKYGNLDDQITITEDAMITEEGASLSGIKPGQILNLKQLLYGLMLPSGNDAANAIAIYISGSIPEFVNLMNHEAASIGAVDTHFTNPHGMTDDDHFTTAYDLYLIMNEAIKYPEFRTICSTKTFIAEFMDNVTDERGNPLAISKTWESTNQYLTGEHELRSGLTLIGGKTGTTMKAGKCMVMALEDESGKEYVEVVLNSDSKKSLYDNLDILSSRIE